MPPVQVRGEAESALLGENTCAPRRIPAAITITITTASKDTPPKTKSFPSTKQNKFMPDQYFYSHAGRINPIRSDLPSCLRMPRTKKSRSYIVIRAPSSQTNRISIGPLRSPGPRLGAQTRGRLNHGRR